METEALVKLFDLVVNDPSEAVPYVIAGLVALVAAVFGVRRKRNRKGPGGGAAGVLLLFFLLPGASGCAAFLDFVKSPEVQRLGIGVACSLAGTGLEAAVDEIPEVWRDLSTEAATEVCRGAAGLIVRDFPSGRRDFCALVDPEELGATEERELRFQEVCFDIRDAAEDAVRGSGQ